MVVDRNSSICVVKLTTRKIKVQSTVNRWISNEIAVGKTLNRTFAAIIIEGVTTARSSLYSGLPIPWQKKSLTQIRHTQFALIIRSCATDFLGRARGALIPFFFFWSPPSIKHRRSSLSFLDRALDRSTLQFGFCWIIHKPLLKSKSCPSFFRPSFFLPAPLAPMGIGRVNS